MNYWLIFLTGLTTGGFTCAAMQGGILTSMLTNLKKESSNTRFGSDDYLPVSSFLIAKLISHVILGALLGALGSAFELSLSLRLFFQGAAALFMLATAFNLLELHPLFRYVCITPPRFLYRLIKNQSLGNLLFAPSLFGFLTVLIPCGVTQAVAVIAVTSGSAVAGALTMGSFVLGTIPLFLLLGLGIARGSEVWRQSFLRVAALALIYLALSSFNGILIAVDSPYSLNRIISVIRTPVTSAPLVAVNGDIQRVSINITNSGYTPNRFAVKADVPVELKVSAGEVYSCATAFTFRAFGINANIRPNTDQIFTFTPTKKGLYTFSCSMGMYSGTMEVI